MLFCFWCGLVSYGVVWCDFDNFLVLTDALLCGLGVIRFGMIWCDIIQVRLGLNCFAFGVIWCPLVWFGVICILFGGNQCFLV